MPKAPRTFGNSKPARKPWQKSGHYKRTLVGEKLQKTKRRILERDDFKCQQCGKMVEYGDSILDHKTPIARGGTDDDENLQVLCLKCSGVKTQQESRGG